MATADSFPRQHARTHRYTLGAPRDVTVASDGSMVAFLRSAGAEDPVTALWVLDLPGGTERCVADPAELLAAGADDLPEAERARRERARESAAGITAYATDLSHMVAVAALAGQLVVADLRGGEAHILDVPGPVIDPRPDPTGTRVAWVREGSLWFTELDSPGQARVLVGDDEPAVSWGVAEFVAAEEMGRYRGFWWAPDGSALLVARVDETPVQRWWIADPATPHRPPTEVRYPSAGTADADVTGWIVSLDGDRTEIAWDRSALPYLAQAGWDDHGPLVTLISRDQQTLEVRSVEPLTGDTTVLWSDTDDSWVERAPGTPARLADGRLVVCSDRNGTRRLVVDGEPVTPEDLYVRGISQVEPGAVLFTANPLHDATYVDVWLWSAGSADRPLERLTNPAGDAPAPGGRGVHAAVTGGGVTVFRRSSLDAWGATVSVAGGPTIQSNAASPARLPEPTIRHVGPRRLPVALLLPPDAGDLGPLPVLLNPYGGPHAQQVVQSLNAYGTSQWFADQGYAVVVVDGRGTPGRGSDWERAVRLDLGTAAVEDQLDGLRALAAEEPQLDLSRVAIRGWSFGGFLAALAVLRHPESIHAAIVGAPVTDWRLYDTFYTERYLGNPHEHPEAYDASSVLAEAPRLERPMMLIHGLADDNVVSAHTLQLSSRLLAAGRPHEVLPLTGVTHMASQEEVAENLLLLQLDFLNRTIG